MAINKAMRAALRFFSYGGIELKSSRRFANLKAVDWKRPLRKTIHYFIRHKDYDIPVRIFMPDDEIIKTKSRAGERLPMLLFFHGGGWVTESVDTYERVCDMMAKSTGHIVTAVDYRLAPEFRFPTQLYDCYEAARRIYRDDFLIHVDPDDITVMGDSAGGNLAAAVCLLAKERKEFMPKRQILIYPATNNDYTDRSPFPSVRENGTDFLLTAQKMEDYLNLYQSSPEDRQNPLFAPILARDLTGMPRTLILTAQYDPLRDEGEAFGKRLEEAGNEVTVCRIPDALHGFFALGIKHLYVQKSFEMINQFLKQDTSKEGEEDGRKQNKPVEKTGQCSDHISGYQRET